jgi:hypothetical protein
MSTGRQLSGSPLLLLLGAMRCRHRMPSAGGDPRSIVAGARTSYHSPRWTSLRRRFIRGTVELMRHSNPGFAAPRDSEVGETQGATGRQVGPPATKRFHESGLSAAAARHGPEELSADMASTTGTTGSGRRQKTSRLNPWVEEQRFGSAMRVSQRARLFNLCRGIPVAKAVVIQLQHRPTQFSTRRSHRTTDSIGDDREGEHLASYLLDRGGHFVTLLGPTREAPRHKVWLIDRETLNCGALP